MSKKLYFLISFVLVLSLTSAGYSYSEHLDAFIMLDFNHNEEPNDVNTEPGWYGFVIDDSGTEVDDVNGNPSGVTVDIGNVITTNSTRRPDPNSENGLFDNGTDDVLVAKEEMYRDCFYGLGNSPLDITLWGLGADRKVKIYIYAYDDSSESRRVANWTANGDYLLTTDFFGNDSDYWPLDPNDIYVQFGLFPNATYYDFNAITYADDVGRIHLACTQDANSEGVPFAFANGLVIVTYGDANDVLKAHRPIPKDGTEELSIHPTLTWWPGAGATKHNVYMGTDPGSLSLVASPTSASYTPSSFLAMDQTYYWRVDELPGPVTGDLWSFTTVNNHLVDDFEAYDPSGNPIHNTWCDYGCNGTSSSVETGEIPTNPALDEKSMKYNFDNLTYPPNYSEAWVELDDLGIDTDFASMNVQALSIWFYGVAGNPVTEQMYAILSDGTNTATVDYPGDMNDIQEEEEWQEWNISMQEFLADNCDVDLGNVSYVGMGFANGAPADGVVYFDDIRLYATRCVLAERSDKLARADYAPIPNTDCVVDDVELEMMARDWLNQDLVVATKNPNDVNLVIYYPLNAGDGNKVYPTVSPYDPCWIGTFWNSSIDPPNDLGSIWVKDSAPGIGDGNCVYTTGEAGGGIRCGTLGNAGIGISRDPEDSQAMTLSLWVKWLGPRYWNPGLLIKGQGLMGKRGDYTENDLIWTFWISANSGEEGGIGLGHRDQTTNIPDLVSPAGTMDPFIGEWAHIAVTYDGNDDPNSTDSAKIYLGGFEVRRGPFSLSFGDDPNLKLTIGQTTNADAWPQGPSSFWGYIDEVRIYSRALEPNEVAYLADPTPEDGLLQIPIPSPAELYEQEPVGQRYVNFRDFAIMADMWLKKEYWP